MNTRSRMALRTLLLTLLLAVQALGHAHAIDHMVQGDNGFCSICSVSGHGNSAIVDSEETAPRQALPHTVPAYSERTVPCSATHLPEARGPPIS